MSARVTVRWMALVAALVAAFIGGIYAMDARNGHVRADDQGDGIIVVHLPDGTQYVADLYPAWDGICPAFTTANDTLTGCVDLYPACVSEDGSGGTLPCRWDATTRGNGTGESFVVYPDGTTVYDDGTVTAIGEVAP